MAMTYTELKAAINSYSENSFDTTDIDTFIQQAEQRIYNEVQIPNQTNRLRSISGIEDLNNRKHE